MYKGADLAWISLLPWAYTGVYDVHLVLAGLEGADGTPTRTCVGDDDECADSTRTLTRMHAHVQCPGYIMPNASAAAANGSAAARPAGGAAGRVCSGHGRCLHETAARDRRCLWFGGRRWLCVDRGLASCSCSFGYVGMDCSQRCPGWNERAAGAAGGRQVCSGHGVCTQYNGSAACSCEFGWAGAACDELRLYVLGSGGHGADVAFNRVVRLGDKMLVNSREQGLHVLALNRSDLTVVWDRNYEVMHFAGADAFFQLGDNDGTVNVHRGDAADGAAGSHNASTGGMLTRSPHVSEVFFREDEANRMARDLSLLDGRHLVVVSSFFAWENQTNPALLQALARIGGPDLAPYAENKLGQGHALVIAGVPDAGAGNGSFILGASPAPYSYAELEVNLALRFESAHVRWCGTRSYEDGVDVSHLKGTACADGNGTVQTYVDGADGVVGGEEGSLGGTSPTSRTDAVPPGSTTAAGSTGMALRWRVVARTNPLDGHHPGGLRLETWDLDTDFDASDGAAPLLVSNATVVQPCCNRTLRWDHGGCRRGRSVSRGTRTVGGEQLVCLESGWVVGDGSAWPGLYGDLRVLAACVADLGGGAVWGLGFRD